MSTHEILNQPPPLVNYNLFESDPILKEALNRAGANWAIDEISALGKIVGSEEFYYWGFKANENPPILHTHDRYGARIDQVEFHPAWHSILQVATQHGVHSGPWKDPCKGAHVARAVKLMLMGQIEAGHSCPISMTYACVPALQHQPELLDKWLPKITSTQYDPRFRPMLEKNGVLLGMGMTEKQGGSDVRTNTTRAVPSIIEGEYWITGHKWFCSAPMCDAFLVLAQAPKGLTCFLLPRWTPDGRANIFFIQRLKNKLGNRSNASSEVEFENTWAHRVGEEGRGVPTIIEMANHTRLDCVSGSVALMRQALSQAVHHTHYRKAFGKTLVEHELMQNVLADLSIEVEASTLLMMRLAEAYDSKADTESAFRRIATPASKYWLCKRTPSFVYEAMECLGGSGYVEESILPRLFRESPLNSIWEGSGNVMCLDVLRAATREKGAKEALFLEIEKGRGTHHQLDPWIDQLKKEFSDSHASEMEGNARRLVEKMILALQGSLLVRYGNPLVAHAFCNSRLDYKWGKTFGTLSGEIDFQQIIKRAKPKLV